MTKKEPIRVLGVDTSLRSTGLGVVEAVGNSFSVIEHTTVKVPARFKLSECLVRLNEEVNGIIERTSPGSVAIEGVFLSRNANTAMILGEARGTVIAACAARGLPVYEYAPRRVKQAVVGFGAADKEQVRKMVMTMLAMKEEPQEDAGDALAIAICHLQSNTSHPALAPKEI